MSSLGNWIRIAIVDLRGDLRRFGILLACLALGVGTIVLLLLVVGQAEERMHRDARGIDLVVGAKGSPMQLMLAGIYQFTPLKASNLK